MPTVGIVGDKRNIARHLHESSITVRTRKTDADWHVTVGFGDRCIRFSMAAKDEPTAADALRHLTALARDVESGTDTTHRDLVDRFYCLVGDSLFGELVYECA